MPLNVAGKTLSNGALAVAGGLVVGLVDTVLPWHSTTIPVAFPSFGVFLGIIAAAVVAVGGSLARSDPQPATAPLSSHQIQSAPPPPPPAV